MASFSIGQEVALTIFQVVTGCCSVAGSLVVLRLSWRRRRSPTTVAPVYQSLMMALSLSDLVASSASMLQGFGLPREYAQQRFAIGTMRTCQAVGFCAVVGSLATAMANAVLAGYFLNTVRRHMKAPAGRWRARGNDPIAEESSCCCMKSARQRWKWTSILLIMGLPLVIGILGLTTESFNPLGYAPCCWLNEWAVPCEADNPDDTCVVHFGSPISELLNLIALVWILVASLASIVMTLMVWCTYRKSIAKSQQFVFGRESRPARRRSSLIQSTAILFGKHTASATFAAESIWVPTSNNRNDAYLARATTQAVLYCCVYCNQFIWLIVAFTISKYVEQADAAFVFLLLGFCLFPLNGLFNAAVYIRPRYLGLRERFPAGELGRSRATWFSIIGAEDDEVIDFVEGQRQRRQSTDANNINTSNSRLAAEKGDKALENTDSGNAQHGHSQPDDHFAADATDATETNRDEEPLNMAAAASLVANEFESFDSPTPSSDDEQSTSGTANADFE